MVFTNAGKQFVTYLLGSQLPNAFISAIATGSGSGTSLVTDNTLIGEFLRNSITGSPDFTENQKVSFQGDFNSVSMSGTTLSEIGLFASPTISTGSLFLRESFGSVAFDGTLELQVSATLEVV